MGDAASGEMTVKRQPECVSEIRAFVGRVVTCWGMDDHLPCLAASELVTNAVRHAVGDEVTVRLALTGDGALWLEVEDASCDMPRIGDVEPIGESGRGLLIVEQVARHWGVRLLAGQAGKVVFAVLGP